MDLCVSFTSPSGSVYTYVGSILMKAVMSAYELNVRGFSEWTNVFTLDEWLSFGYTQDLQFYYCAG